MVLDTRSGNNCPPDTLHAGVIEQFALFYGPCEVIIVITVIAMVVMVITVAHRAYRHRILNTSGNQQWRALKQLLQLATYPLLLCFLFVPPFVYRVFMAAHSPNTGLSVATAICFSGWSLLVGVTLLIHICVVKCCGKKAPTMNRFYQYICIQTRIWNTRTHTHVHVSAIFSSPSVSISLGSITLPFGSLPVQQACNLVITAAIYL